MTSESNVKVDPKVLLRPGGIFRDVVGLSTEQVQWSEFIGRRLFPGVTYRHAVLTMPDSLQRWHAAKTCWGWNRLFVSYPPQPRQARLSV